MTPKHVTVYLHSNFPFQLGADKTPVCNCVTEPCDCDGSSKTDYQGGPVYQEPDWDQDEPTKGPATNTQVKTTAATNDDVADTTDTATNGDDDGEETTLIFGYPWYYAAGAAAVIGIFFLGGNSK